MRLGPSGTTGRNGNVEQLLNILTEHLLQPEPYQQRRFASSEHGIRTAAVVPLEIAIVEVGSSRLRSASAITNAEVPVFWAREQAVTTK